MPLAHPPTVWLFIINTMCSFALMDVNLVMKKCVHVYIHSYTMHTMNIDQHEHAHLLALRSLLHSWCLSLIHYMSFQINCCLKINLVQHQNWKLESFDWDLIDWLFLLGLVYCSTNKGCCRNFLPQYLTVTLNTTACVYTSEAGGCPTWWSHAGVAIHTTHCQLAVA